ncbi:alkaline phytoceramidase [Auriculariales sp. MPI-PUGE-AT-0066]|nr:alkaline phytoceramidase [Auriculariales sp. MPI-PUGE-AT-0066]
MDLALWSIPATIDWCEDNYKFSSLVAEVANTFSNVFGIALAIYGCHFSLKEKLPLRYFLCFTLFAVVGLGSMAFHASLKYAAQLLDEIPMILCVSQSVFILCSTTSGRVAPRWSALTGLILAFDISFVAAYLAYPNPVFHQVVFGTLMVLTAGRVVFLLGLFGLPNKTPMLSTQVKQTSTPIFWVGASSFILGFAIWNFDNVFCSKLASWRQVVGFPCAFLLEGHAWWHVLSAIGTYAMLVGLTCEYSILGWVVESMAEERPDLSLCLSEGEDRYAIHFHYGVLPLVCRRQLIDASPVEKMK